MNYLSGGFGGDLIQRRGGLLPGSPGQTTCDACSGPLDPTEAVEVTVTAGATTGCYRLAAHSRCRQALAARLAVQLGGVPDPEPLTVPEKVAQLVERGRGG